MVKIIFKILSALLITYNIYVPTTLASYTVYPVHIKVNEKEQVAEFNIINKSDADKNFHLFIHKREDPNDKKSYKETKDFIVSPVMFKLAPSAKQLIRFKIADNKNLNKFERGYKVIVKELPKKKRDKDDHRLQLLMTFEIPLTIESQTLAHRN